MITVAKTSPQAMARIIGIKNALSPPHPYAVGKRPAQVVVVVSRMGRSRAVAASDMVSGVIPTVSRFRLIKLMRMSELLTTTPVNPIIPIKAIKLNGRLCP